MNWKIFIAERAQKDLKRLPQNDAIRVKQTIDGFRENPYAGDIEKLEGETYSWRRRIGAFRITYEVDVKEKIVRVFKIKRRTSTTYRKRR